MLQARRELERLWLTQSPKIMTGLFVTKITDTWRRLTIVSRA